MVLFKRKPVQYLPTPAVDEDQEIWIIGETDEAFTSYEQYLSRIDYYRQKRFICEITGHSGLDFFTALKNETDATNEVDESFPAPLREPVLRKVQHSTVSRIDNLVDWVYDEFKQDFYPGETVLVVLEGHEKMAGTVREKRRFREQVRGEDGNVQTPAAVRYFVSLSDRLDQEAIVDQFHLVRDRKALTKMMLRSFLKTSLTREAWSGAPWELKEKIAHQYNISTQIPFHLRHEHQLAQRKYQLGMKKGELTNGNLSKLLPDFKTKGKGKSEALKFRQAQFEEYQKALSRNPTFQGPEKALAANDPQFLEFLRKNPEFAALASKQLLGKVDKGPFEDLDIEVSSNTRPPLRFLSSPTSSDIHMNGDGGAIAEESVGPLLETWNTLNVFCEVFLLDSFTFDDFVDALQPTADGLPCELLSEIHCAVLKTLVNAETDSNGKVQIRLPTTDDSDDEESDEESEEDDEEESSGEKSDSEPEIVARSTRSSLARTQAAQLKAQAELDAKLHYGPEIDQCVKGYGWKQRLRKRDLANGRWVLIVIGLLNLYTADPRQKQTCDEILAHMAPLHLKPSEDAAILQYAEIDIGVRVKLLQFLCLLTVDTAVIRNYMDECMLSMTECRKNRIEFQRHRKQHLEELKALEEERQALQPEAKSPVAEIEELEEQIEEVESKEGDDDGDITMEDEDDIPQRSLRRAQDRDAERRKRQEEDKRRKEKAKFDKANKPSKEARKLEKLLKQIEDVKDKIRETEEEMADCDNELRESDCHRTRVLGRDRFWNRYYWYERNAMPYGGLPDSSTADAGYANGRLWVQGPDEMERVGYLQLPESDMAKYRSTHKMTPFERKVQEEGSTHTHSATQWGYYDDPADVDALIAWLNETGVRESKLRKELQLNRERIAEHMKKRQQYINPRADAEPEVAAEQPQQRISTRTRTHADAQSPRCARWHNSAALRENGHLHSEPLKPKRGVTRTIQLGLRKARLSDEDGFVARAGAGRGGRGGRGRAAAQNLKFQFYRP